MSILSTASTDFQVRMRDAFRSVSSKISSEDFIYLLTRTHNHDAAKALGADVEKLYEDIQTTYTNIITMMISYIMNEQKMQKIHHEARIEHAFWMCLRTTDCLSDGVINAHMKNIRSHLATKMARSRSRDEIVTLSLNMPHTIVCAHFHVLFGVIID
jgi:hypothetical protein